MPLVTSTYAYVFIFRLTHKKTQRTEEHSVKTVAYNLSEGLTQVAYALDAEHGIDIKEYDLKVIFAGPDVEEIAKTLVDAMQRGAR